MLIQTMKYIYNIYIYTCIYRRLKNRPLEINASNGHGGRKQKKAKKKNSLGWSRIFDDDLHFKTWNAWIRYAKSESDLEPVCSSKSKRDKASGKWRERKVWDFGENEAQYREGKKKELKQQWSVLCEAQTYGRRNIDGDSLPFLYGV